MEHFLFQGIAPVLPIFREGILNGAQDVKEAAALGLREVIALTSSEALKPSVVNITGPLIRILGDRFMWNVKVAVLETLTLLLSKVSSHAVMLCVYLTWQSLAACVFLTFGKVWFCVYLFDIWLCSEVCVCLFDKWQSPFLCVSLFDMWQSPFLCVSLFDIWQSPFLCVSLTYGKALLGVSLAYGKVLLCASLFDIWEVLLYVCVSVAVYCFIIWQ